MKAKIRLLVVILLLAGGGYAYWQQRTDTAAAPGALKLYGNVDVREVDLAFRQAGRLQSLRVDEGAAVQQGQLLATLDERPFQDRYAAALAEVALADANLAKLRHGNRPQDIQRARQAVHQAEAQRRKTRSDLERQSGLAATGAVSQKVWEMARLADEQAAAALVAAQQSLSLLREGARAEDIAIAIARHDATMAALAQAQTMLDDTRLIAPDDGIISNRIREPGSMVSSRDAVYTLTLRHPVYVRAYVSEAELGRVAPGKAVTLRSDSSPRSYHGHIGFISPRAEFTPRAVETESLRTDLVYRLRIVVDDGNDALRQGMPVSISLIES